MCERDKVGYHWRGTHQQHAQQKVGVLRLQHNKGHDAKAEGGKHLKQHACAYLVFIAVAMKMYDANNVDQGNERKADHLRWL